jgi:uncharacterized membrane protein
LREWLEIGTEHAVVAIDFIALVVVALATIAAVLGGVRALVTGADNHAKRDIWLGYARWLVAALTLQLGADIIESSITPTWEAIVRLGAVAVVRTFLNYFLERDLAEVRERQREDRRGAEPTTTGS